MFNHYASFTRRDYVKTLRVRVLCNYAKSYNDFHSKKIIQTGKMQKLLTVI